jgi:hypothetical protein
MKVKREMPLSDALEEISTVVQNLKGNGSAKVNGHEIGLDDRVTLEIESESSKKGGELEFEIKWPPEKSKSKGKAKAVNGKAKGGKRRWFVWALTGAVLGGAALYAAKKRRGSSEEDQYSGEF